jgi:hypothetical protein
MHCAEQERRVNRLRDELGSAEFARSWQAGLNFDLEESIAYALGTDEVVHED